MVAHFFKLPLEIRALVFEELLLENTEAPKDDRLKNLIPVKVFAECFYEGAPRKTEERVRPILDMNALPIWLQTCKPFRDEGLQTLARCGRVHIGNVCSNSDINAAVAERARTQYDVYFIGTYPYLANPGYDENEHNCKKWHNRDTFPGVLAAISPRRLVVEFEAISITSCALVNPLDNWQKEEVLLCRDLFAQVCDKNGVREWKLIFKSELSGCEREWKIAFHNMGYLLEGMRAKLDRLEVIITVGEENTIEERHIVGAEAFMEGPLEGAADGLDLDEMK